METDCGKSIDDGSGTLEESEIEPCLKDDSAADFAEVMRAMDDLEPGDVLIIGADGALALSTEPHQSNVMGVYSTDPSYIGGAQFLGEPGYVPLAVVGIVPVKVSAENGPISPGDLLTTSSMPGHAMRCVGFELCFGTTIGKALEGLDSGTGVIMMMVVLQ